MSKIYSRVTEGKLLHMIVRKQDIAAGRTDLCPTDEFLQVAALRLPKDTTFKPHHHIWHRFNGDRIPQESWVCITGNVKVFLYDLDGSLMHTDILTPGDISITMHAGHNYEIMSENTLVYEYKTGPYLGQEFDKKFL